MERGKKNGLNQPTIIAGVRGIGPNSSGSLTPLIGLTLEEVKGAVMSNYLVVPRVTINTIIWQNWDIFSKLRYRWKVVRSRPGSVKLFIDVNNISAYGECFLCEPFPEKPDKYRAVLLSRYGSIIKLILSSGSLLEALNRCEAYANRKKLSSKDSLLRVSTSAASPDSDEVCYLDILKDKTYDEDGYVQQFYVSKEFVEQVKAASRSYLGYVPHFCATSIREQLIDDAEPPQNAYYNEAIQSIIENGYNESMVDILSRREIDYVA